MKQTGLLTIGPDQETRLCFPHFSPKYQETNLALKLNLSIMFGATHRNTIRS